jgi:4-amino-4-deoxy-L-arabinose transferase-like glycosyltransferase
MFFFSLSILLLLYLLRNPSTWLAIAVGASIGASLLTKYVTVFILPIGFTFCALNRSLKKYKFELGLALMVAITLLAIWLAYSFSIGIFGAQSKIVTTLDPTFFVSSSYGLRFLLNSVLTRLPSAIGLYNAPLILLGGLFILRRRSRFDLFILSWLFIVMFFLFLTLPDHRYFMPTFPALAITMAIWLKENPEINEQLLLLILFYAGGSMYLFFDWTREAQLFM